MLPNARWRYLLLLLSALSVAHIVVMVVEVQYDQSKINADSNVIELHEFLRQNPNFQDDSHLFPNLNVSFENFDNINGSDSILVPNIFHYIRWQKKEFSFVDYLCIQSLFINHNPDRIFFHTNVRFRGHYWGRIQNNTKLAKKVRIVYNEPPLEIFGQELRKRWRYYHGSDLARMRILMKYGGIYLDNDVYIINSLNKYRHYEMTLGWEEGEEIGSQVLIANKNARFLPKWLDSYKEYYPYLWYYNAGIKPTYDILEKEPYLVHRVKKQFGVKWLLHQLYSETWEEWKTLDTIHLLVNHRTFYRGYYDPPFTEESAKNFEYTFGDMARDILSHEVASSVSVP